MSRNVIKRTPKERCEYFMRIARQFKRESEYHLAKDSANKGLNIASKHNLEEYRQAFQKFLGELK